MGGTAVLGAFLFLLLKMFRASKVKIKLVIKQLLAIRQFVVVQQLQQRSWHACSCVWRGRCCGNCTDPSSALVKLTELSCRRLVCNGTGSGDFLRNCDGEGVRELAKSARCCSFPILLELEYGLSMGY